MAWLDRRWLTLEALKAEWKRKDIRAWLFGLATVAVVMALILSPETLPTALYIDSVGLELFLALLGLNMVVGLILYRQQFVTFLRATYALHGVGATVMRKSVALPRYSWAALNGDFH